MNTNPVDPPPALTRARLPRWSLPADWPIAQGQPALADIAWAAGRVTSVRPSVMPAAGACDLDGAPLLPGLVDAHTHIDKTFTLDRLGTVPPGLLSAIEAMRQDSQCWTPSDVRARAGRALNWAFDAGVVRLRTHVDWREPQRAPLAWSVLHDLADEWTDRLTVDRVSLIPLDLFQDRSQAMALARMVAATGPGALLGGFVHTTHWDASALRHLFEAAQAFDLDVDLHVDEELNPAATGLAETARLLRDIDFGGRVVCGHACALAAQDDACALTTLDAVARAPITMVSLPITNLLLQDARTGRTPRQRGITLVKEARERGIPVLIASDNVQDAFCTVGSYDPVEALFVGALAAQLDAAFDVWSESLCRADWLGRAAPARAHAWIGAHADFVAFTSTDVRGWPSRAQPRVVWRDGSVVAGQLPAAWLDRSARREPASANALISKENTA
jgi:cytosine deaminase